ncbi:hypothetical protein ACFYWN_29250 [Streptomyces sp. NPDC002917]|uniref:hypothetical protein n=1 Tax=Streptomyces sp. NPDC002917 TaxID=3364671 RepID=UPI003673BDA7
MAHSAVRTDAATLISNIPAETIDAFENFLDQHGIEISANRTTAVRVITSVFHRYCRRVLHIEPPCGTEVIRMLDVGGYLPEWITIKTGDPLLIVRGLQLDDAAMKGEFTNA